MDQVETCMDLNLRMQSILVKQQVLEALNKHENPDDEEEDQDEESSQEESSEEDEEDLNRDDTLKGSELLMFDNNQQDEDDMDFGDSNESAKVKPVNINDEDLLLDNYYNKNQKIKNEFNTNVND